MQLFRSEYADRLQERPLLCSLETMRTSRSPTTVMTANGEVQTREATVYVKQLDLFVNVMFLEDHRRRGHVRIFVTTSPSNGTCTTPPTPLPYGPLNRSVEIRISVSLRYSNVTPRASF